MRPSKVILRTEGACEFDPEHLLDVFSEQRLRFVAVLQGFGPDDWAGPTRCADWSAHDVVRHLCDCNGIPAATATNDEMLVVTAGYDPRITPRGWLTASANESTAATFHRFVATTEEAFALARGWLAENRRLDVRLPYGPVDWTILMLHGLWDSWIHERDVLLAQGIEHPTDQDATFYVTAYGLFLAAAVASMFGDPLQEKLKLGGDGGGVFDLDSRGGVTLTVNRVTTAGPPAAKVADALAGRSPVDAALGGLSARSRAALSRMADFFNTPVEPGPT
jgi:uncharacterized protein (TIGR03083 family)